MFTILSIPVELLRKQSRHLSAAFLVRTFLLLAILLSFNPTGVTAAPSAVTWPTITIVPVESGFRRAIDLVSPNDGSGRLFVIEQRGHIYIIENGESLPTPFLNISDRVTGPASCNECGLLGLAFPSDFAEEGYFFVNYTSKEDLIGPDTGDPDPDAIGDTVIARFHVTDDPNIADPNSEERILIVNQPDTNHNGGHILFGPDDHLYIGMGDGGDGGDTYQNAQNPASLLGKILRIQVSETSTYTIPTDNPFIDKTNYRDEIWAEGVRNPWRFGFDRATGDFYLADVGQQTYEEVNYLADADIGNGGMNFGWPIMEGNVCYPPNGPQNCDRTDLTEPVITYDHALGDCSITGGYVFDSEAGNQPPVYLYADLCSGRVWGMQRAGETWVSALLEDFDFRISSFGEGEDGDLFIVDMDGTIYRIEEVIPEAIAGLSASNNGPTEANSPTTFSASVSAGTHISYAWDFGDGTSGSGATPSHTYEEAGVYTATVEASNATNSMTDTTTVYVGDKIVAVTSNQYTPNNFTIEAGQTVIWELVAGNHSVTAADGSFEQPLGSDWPPFVQSFSSAAALSETTVSYYCSLHQSLGMTGTFTIVPEGTGGPPPVAGLSAANNGPKQVNEAVAFTATISGGTEISYTWNFGDGTGSSGITTTHAYTAAGVYTATVVASNTTNSMTATTTVYVGDAVVDVRNFDYRPRAITLPVGSTVVWVLRNGTHSVTADDNSFEQAAGGNWPPFVQTFNSVNSYPYHCTLHGGKGGVGMAGTVTVTEAVGEREELRLPNIRNAGEANGNQE